MKRFISLFLFLFFCRTFLSGNTSYFVLSNYQNTVIMNNSNIVLIEKGDSPEYKKPAYNDSLWKRVYVPSKWQETAFPGWNGTCWYRIHVQFPNEIPERSLGINLGMISDIDETYFNGILIGKEGSFENNKSHAYDKIRIYEIPSQLIKPGKDNVFSIRVKGYFSYEAGLINGLIMIAPYQKITHHYFLTEYIKTFLTIVIIVFGLYFLLFYVRIEKGSDNLFFGLFCLFFSIYFFMHSEVKYFIIQDFMLLKRIEYICLFTVVPLFFEFILRHFNQKRNILHYIFYAVSAGCIITALISSEPALWDFLNINIYQYSWTIPIISIFIILLRERRKNKDALVMLYPMIFMILTVIMDIIISKNVITSPLLNALAPFSPYGFLIFILSTSFVLSNKFTRLYREIEIKKADLEKTLWERDNAFRKVDFAYLEAINRMAIIAELRDPETGAHIKRVSLYVKLLAEKMGLSGEEVENLYFAAPMHDVGKVGIPDRILFKKGRLSQKEWKIMEKHTVIGGKIFDGAGSLVLMTARQIALYHHEKWDGSGYPERLKGKLIPLPGRIMAFADIYDALRSARPYKYELSHEKAVDIISHGDDRVNPAHFDPELLKIFLANSYLFNEIYEMNKD